MGRLGVDVVGSDEDGGSMRFEEGKDEVEIINIEERMDGVELGEFSESRGGQDDISGKERCGDGREKESARGKEERKENLRGNGQLVEGNEIGILKSGTETTLTDVRACGKAKAQELFFTFMSKEGKKLVEELLKEVNESLRGSALHKSARKEKGLVLQPVALTNLIAELNVFPLSPGAMSPGELSNRLALKVKHEEFADFRLDRENSSQRGRKLTTRPIGSRRESFSSAISENIEPSNNQIPSFYYPHGEGLEEMEEREEDLIVEFFRQGCATSYDFGELTVEVIGLPSFYSSILFQRIMDSAEYNPGKDSAMSIEIFRKYYKKECSKRNKHERLFYSLLNAQDRNYLLPKDLEPIIRGLLEYHPGLAFLDSTPEFQMRYSETVIQRIYYTCAGTQCNSRLFLKQLERGGVLDTMMYVDEEEDINLEKRFFSYEHFYVLYCGFWELDTDHDLLISFEDLLRYRGYSLTYRIVERVFAGYGRPLDSGTEGCMSYNDYIWFALSEEDKKHPTAIDYWFRCLDLDGDGKVCLYDLDSFYSEQLRRMDCLGHELVPLKDIVCQCMDMICGGRCDVVYISRSDLKNSQLASEFFNILFNMNKFFAQESREAVRLRRGQEKMDMSDWEHFAAAEYQRLTAEEEDDIGDYRSWDELGDQGGILLDSGDSM